MTRPLAMGMPLSPPPTTLRRTCDLPVAEASASCDADRLLPSTPVADEDRQRGSQLLSPLSTDWSQHRRISDASEDPDHHDTSMLLCPLPPARPQHDHVRIHSEVVQATTLQWSSWPIHSPPFPSAPSLVFGIEDAHHHPSLLNINPEFYRSHEHLTDAQCIHDDERMDVDDQPDHTRAPLWHPPFSPLSDIGDERDYLPSPDSPYLRDLTDLPELDDSEEYPESPSLRTFTDLPDAQVDEEINHAQAPSPTPTLISLPGADTDDDLLPAEHGTPKIYDKYSGSIFADIGSNASASLLLADPDLVLVPDSPPVENLDIDVTLLSQDPLLRRLSVIRKKSQAVERQLRQLEAQMLEQGAVHARAHVRQERRKHKEKFRETTALIRLNLGDEVFSSPFSEEHNGAPKVKNVTSKDQLVARMILKRHENFRPLSVRKCISLDPLTWKSPLSRFPVQKAETAEF